MPIAHLFQVRPLAGSVDPSRHPDCTIRISPEGRVRAVEYPVWILFCVLPTDSPVGFRDWTYPFSSSTKPPYGLLRTSPMDLNKSASQPKSPDAKMEAGSTSSRLVNVKAETPSITEADAPVAPPRRGAGSPKKDSAIVPEGIRWRESYCLFVRVQRDGDAIPKRDQRIDPLAWNEVICQKHLWEPARSRARYFLSTTAQRHRVHSYEGKKGWTWNDLG